MVDLADGSIVDDMEAIEQAEREAYRAKYGKLEPALYERLQTMKPEERVPVAIWAAGRPRRSEKELFDALAAKYPEAKAALERSGKPFAVSDLGLMKEIKAEYVRMLAADTQVQIQPLVDYLKAQGFNVTTLGAIPVVALTLPKEAILQIVSRPDVGAIYLTEEREKPKLDTAVPSDRAPVVWRRGFDGSGVSIAVLEGGKVDFDSQEAGHNWLHQGEVRDCALGLSEHKTRVASVAASYHFTTTGVAPGATIVDACEDRTETDIVAGLQWATQRTDVTNYSAGAEEDNELHFLDRAFDHWARTRYDTIVVVAGNSGASICSPGKGWNVITVGGTDNKETSGWSDDEWWPASGWTNPTGGDREKPEVVAPVQDITAIGLDNNQTTQSGTSFAAPQVAGVAALLIDRNSILAAWPEAIRAIIMASALNNVDGPTGIPTGLDLKDGAGAIDAALADITAKTHCSADSSSPFPCWWGEEITHTTFPSGTFLFRDFRALRGERIRVAISWWSNADCPSQYQCNYDRLDTNLNLYVYDPDDQLVAYSASWDNNYELVDFTAPKTGIYTIGVYNARFDENRSNYVGIAWVKDATYLPDLRNKDGWVSEIYLRNDGAEPRNVTVHYFDSGITETFSLDPNQRQQILVSAGNRIPAGTIGSAIVDGGEDVSVIVRTPSTGRGYSYAGISTAGGSGNAGFGVAGNLARLPNLACDYYTYNTPIRVQNVSAQSDAVTARFYNRSGDQVGNDYHSSSISAGSSFEIDPCWRTGINYVGAGLVTPDNAATDLATIVRQDWSTYDSAAYNGFIAGETILYLPNVAKEYSGWTTFFAVHNTSNITAYVDITWYDDQGGVSRSDYTFPNIEIKPMGQLGFNPLNKPIPPNFRGSAVITSTGGQPVVAIVNQNGSEHNEFGSYDGFLAGSSTVVLPFVAKAYTGPPDLHTTFAVQNVGNAPTTVKALFYEAPGNIQQPCPSDGYYLPAGQPLEIQPKRMIGVNPSNIPCLPGAFSGSAVLVSSGQPIVAIVNIHLPNAADPYLDSYNGINR